MASSSRPGRLGLALITPVVALQVRVPSPSPRYRLPRAARPVGGANPRRTSAATMQSFEVGSSSKRVNVAPEKLRQSRIVLASKCTQELRAWQVKGESLREDRHRSIGSYRLIKSKRCRSRSNRRNPRSSGAYAACKTLGHDIKHGFVTLPVADCHFHIQVATGCPGGQGLATRMWTHGPSVRCRRRRLLVSSDVPSRHWSLGRAGPGPPQARRAWATPARCCHWTQPSLGISAEAP